MPKKRNAGKAASGMNYRAVPLKKTETGTPATLDEATRSVEIVLATEMPVTVFDWERWEPVLEVLLMSGCQVPPNRQVPLLDTHMRYDTSTVIGSCRELVVNGSELHSRAHYSTAPEAEGPYLKMTEGHLTDYSVGYRYDKKDAIYVPEGENAIIDGRTFTGPVKVVRKWFVKEGSACPIGADEMAKARAATPPVTQHEEENEMDQKLRAFLESRGLSKDATEEEAWRFLEKLEVRAATPQPANPTTPAAKTEDQIREEGARAEQERIQGIRAICLRAGLDDKKAEEFITGRKTVEDVRQMAFDHLTATAPEPTGFRGQVELGADARDKFRSAAEGALILRSGRTVSEDLIKLGARDLAGFTLIEMARESLRMAGQPVYGNVLDVIGRSFTTSDFPLLLANVANKSLLEGWETQDETWPAWVAEGSVSDFKTHTAVRPGEVDSLDEIGEDDEYKYGARSEQQEQYKIATFGKLFKLSRQTIINDDLAALTDTPREHGEAATRTVGDVVYAVLTANAAMGDSVALFHTATHKNLAGSGAVVSVDTLGAAEVAMGLQKDIGGKRRLNIKPVFFICPLTKKPGAEQFFTTPVIGTQASPNLQNIYSGAFFTRIYEPRLDDSSTTAWYLAARKGKTVKVFFLNGNKTPFLDTKQGWNVDGVEFKVRIDCGAKAMSWKGLYKNPGA